MPRLTRIYTRTGDDGTTALGSGARVGKDDLRIDTYGTVDELNAVLGCVAAAGLDADLRPIVATVQNELFHLGCDLCFPEEKKGRNSVPRIERRQVEALEQLMDRLTERLGPLENFILPGGSAAGAHLHLARCVCRRAERLAVALQRREPIGECVLIYLNRLSDALFVMARYENLRAGVADVCWNSRA
ncbi:MAG: cob(I)yrinic acid a,c-diamide adenosyltransferase [Phycisphaerae bacterium]